MARRWTSDDLKSLTAFLSPPSATESAPPKTSKYGNTSVIQAGVRYASKLEARYARDLALEMQSGAVAWFTRQVPFLLPGDIRYYADFLVVRNGSGSQYIPAPQTIQVIDCKGAMTRVSLNKLKQVKALYGFSVLIFRKDGSLFPFDSTEHT